MTSAGVGEGRDARLSGPRPWEILVTVAAVALYARTVTFGWAFDDQMEIVRNGFVHSFAYLPEIFRTTLWTGSGMETYLYRPLVLVTYALNHALSGLNAWSYHLVNVVLHAMASVLVFRVGRLWGLPAHAAGIGALVFAVHPVHVEVVANVAGRKDLLATVFLLAMALSHRWALRRSVLRVALPLALYVCAMLSKEIGAMGLFMVAAQDAFVEPDRKAFFNRTPVMGIYFGYAGALVAFLLVRLAVTGVAGVPETFVFDNPLVEEGTAVRVATGLAVVGKGLFLLLVPFSLSADYSYDAIPVVRSAFDARLWITLAVLGLIGWRLARSENRGSPYSLGTAWYILALLPASNLLIVVGTIFGERLLYLPSVAFCLIAGTGVAWGWARLPRVALVGGSVMLVGFATQTVRYSEAWSDDIALFEWAVRSVPASTKAHHKLGEEYLRAGRLGDALRSLEQALRIAPTNAFAAATRSRAEQAVLARHGNEGEVTPNDPDVLYVLGQARMASGDPSGAVRDWERALSLDPAHAPSLSDLAATRLDAGDTASAVQYLERATTADPGLASSWFNLAGVRLSQGRTEDAARALRNFLSTGAVRYPEQASWAEETLRRIEGR